MDINALTKQTSDAYVAILDNVQTMRTALKVVTAQLMVANSENESLRKEIEDGKKDNKKGSKNQKG